MPDQLSAELYTSGDDPPVWQGKFQQLKSALGAALTHALARPDKIMLLLLHETSEDRVELIKQNSDQAEMGVLIDQVNA